MGGTVLTLSSPLEGGEIEGKGVSGKETFTKRVVWYVIDAHIELGLKLEGP